MKTIFEQFFSSAAYGVVGASVNRAKFGNKVLRCYQQHNKAVFPVHPREKQIEGIDCYATVAELPDLVKSLSLITPPTISERIVELAYAKGITSIWMQPGAQSELAIQKCREYGINVIADGSCLLVELGCH